MVNSLKCILLVPNQVVKNNHKTYFYQSHLKQQNELIDAKICTSDIIAQIGWLWWILAQIGYTKKIHFNPWNQIPSSYDSLAKEDWSFYCPWRKHWNFLFVTYDKICKFWIHISIKGPNLAKRGEEIQSLWGKK